MRVLKRPIFRKVFRNKASLRYMIGTLTSKSAGDRAAHKTDLMGLKGLPNSSEADMYLVFKFKKSTQRCQRTDNSSIPTT